MWHWKSSWPESSCGCCERMAGSDGSTAKEEITIHLFIRMGGGAASSESDCVPCVLTHCSVQTALDADEL